MCLTRSARVSVRPEPAYRPPVPGIDLTGLRRHRQGLVLTSLAAMLWLGALGSQAQVLFIDQAGVSNELPSAVTPGPPANVQLTLAVLRHTPKGRPLLPSQLQACSSIPELAGALQQEPVGAPAPKPAKKPAPPPGGIVEVLYHAQRELAMAPTGMVAFTTQESRPAFQTTGGPANSLTNRNYGMVLVVRTRWVQTQFASANTAPAATALGILLEWEGNFAWSEALLAKWEKVALSLFQTASKLPGITYESQAEDEDGFVSSGTGTDLSRLFRRKKKAPPGAPASAATLSEPSYLADTSWREVQLRGRRIFLEQDLAIATFQIPGSPPPGESLYVVLHARRNL